MNHLANNTFLPPVSAIPFSHLCSVLSDGLLAEEDGFELGKVHAVVLLAELQEVEDGAVRGVQGGRVPGQNHRHLLLQQINKYMWSATLDI
jgi:hypothetical protein